MSLNILHNYFKFIFSLPSGTSPSGPINKRFIKGNLALDNKTLEKQSIAHRHFQSQAEILLTTH